MGEGREMGRVSSWVLSYSEMFLWLTSKRIYTSCQVAFKYIRLKSGGCWIDFKTNVDS